MSGWYPDPQAWYVDGPPPDRPLFQGDVFRGVPTLFADHPAAREAAFAGLTEPGRAAAERPVDAAAARAATTVHGGYTMVLPYPCDFADGEKGAQHSVRVVARLLRVREQQVPRRQLVGGRVHHAVWVPDWRSPEDPQRDWLLDLRTTTSVHAAWLNPTRRVAALRVAPWIALMRRIAVFYTRTSPDITQLAADHAWIHPDAPG